MKSKRAIGYKEIASVLLIVMILMIHAIKLFHLHTPAKSIECTSQAVQVTVDNTCLICDYHLTKDAEISFSITQVVKQRVSILYPILYTSQTVASIGLHYSDRGPPALG